jgi:hypothetical protein
MLHLYKAYQKVCTVQILMKNPSIQPDHQNLKISERHRKRGGMSFSMLNSHIGMSTKNNSMRLNVNPLIITTFRTAIPKNGR